MSMRAIKDEYTLVNALAPVATAATKTSSSIDLANVEANAIAIVPGVWTDGTHTFTVEESADDTTYTTVAAADLVGSLAVVSGTAGAVVQKVSYIGSKRYIHVIDTVAGGTTGMVLGIQAFLKKRKQP